MGRDRYPRQLPRVLEGARPCDRKWNRARSAIRRPSTLKAILPTKGLFRPATRLRLYAARQPVGKEDCVLASLRQAARSALRSAVMQGSTFAAYSGLVKKSVGRGVKLFLSGKTYTVSYEIINNYQLNGNVLTYSVGTNTTKFFWNGKNY